MWNYPTSLHLGQKNYKTSLDKCWNYKRKPCNHGFEKLPFQLLNLIDSHSNILKYTAFIFNQPQKGGDSIVLNFSFFNMFANYSKMVGPILINI